MDDVTPDEMVCPVERISECWLLPVLGLIVAAFPFTIKGVHRDNGRDYINRVVAALVATVYIDVTPASWQ